MKTEALTITAIGAIINVVLSGAKITVGVFGRSSALIADGIHSLSDLSSDAVVVFGVRAAQRPPDDNHTFGHGRYETVSALFVGLILLAAGGAIGWHAVTRVMYLRSGGEIASPRIVAAIIALVSVGVKEVLFRATRRVGRATGSEVLIANAWHHRSDALSSVATFIGISGAILLGEEWIILDPLTASIVSLLVVGVGLQTMGRALKEMTDHALSETECQELLEIVQAVEGVRDPHNLKTRRLGPTVAVEVHFRVPGEMTVQEGHRRATIVEKRIKDHFGSTTTVITHVEPVIDPSELNDSK